MSSVPPEGPPPPSDGSSAVPPDAFRPIPPAAGFGTGGPPAYAPPSKPGPPMGTPYPARPQPPLAGEPYPQSGRRGNGVGLAALITGIVALVLSVIPYLCFLGWFPAIAAIVLGIVGLVLQGRKRGFAIAGLVLGAVALVASIVVSAILIAGFLQSASRAVPSGPGAFGGDPSATSSAAPSQALVPVLPAGPHTIVYSVTGGGRATVSYYAYAGGHSGSARSTTGLPFTKSERFTSKQGDFGSYTLFATSSSGGGKPLTCTITVDGTTLITRTSPARDFNYVSCTARSQ